MTSSARLWRSQTHLERSQGGRVRGEQQPPKTISVSTMPLAPTHSTPNVRRQTATLLIFLISPRCRQQPTESVWSGPTFQTHLDRAHSDGMRGEQQCSAFFATPCAPRTLALECEANSNSFWGLSCSNQHCLTHRAHPSPRPALHARRSPTLDQDWRTPHPARDHGLFPRTFVRSPTQTTRARKSPPACGGQEATTRGFGALCPPTPRHSLAAVRGHSPRSRKGGDANQKPWARSATPPTVQRRLGANTCTPSVTPRSGEHEVGHSLPCFEGTEAEPTGAGP